MPKAYYSTKNQLRGKNKLFLMVGILVLVFILINFINNFGKTRQINQEITNLDQEIQALEQSNSELSELVKYLNSAAYLEETARRELGFQKEGEKKIIIPDWQKNSATASPQTGTNNLSTNQGNLHKWWRYFFNSN